MVNQILFDHNMRSIIAVLSSSAVPVEHPPVLQHDYCTSTRTVPHANIHVHMRSGILRAYGTVLYMYVYGEGLYVYVEQCYVHMWRGTVRVCGTVLYMYICGEGLYVYVEQCCICTYVERDCMCMWNSAVYVRTRSGTVCVCGVHVQTWNGTVCVHVHAWD